MARKYHRVLFMCRKCRSLGVVRIGCEDTLVEALEKIKKVTDKCCPHCGEEPYENWMLDDVELLPEASQF